MSVWASYYLLIHLRLCGKAAARSSRRGNDPLPGPRLMGKKLGSSITGVNDALRLCVGDPGDAALVGTSPNPARVVPVGEKRCV